MYENQEQMPKLPEMIGRFQEVMTALVTLLLWGMPYNEVVQAILDYQENKPALAVGNYPINELSAN